MSDSDDDWFEKDIDEIVEEAAKKKTSTEDWSTGGASHNADWVKYALGGDYGGNYDLPAEKPKDAKNQKRNQTKGDFVQKISFTKLKFISEQTPLDGFLEIYQDDCGFFEALADPQLTGDFVKLAVKVLADLITLPLFEHKKEYLGAFVKNSFLQQVEGVLVKSLAESTAKPKKKTLFQISTNELVEYVVKVCQEVVRANIGGDGFEAFLKKFAAVLDEQGKLPEPLNEIRRLLKKLEAKKTEKVEQIYPTLDELKATEMKDLTPNIIKGKYDSVNHYIEIQRSLIREDFILPLREAIAQLKTYPSVDDVPKGKIYKSTKFMLSDVLNSKTHKSEMLWVDLKANQRSTLLDGTTISPETDSDSNKFMFGSLLLFTTSLEFNNLVLATISSCDPEIIANGFIQVEIVKIYGVSKIFDTEFLMFESEVYFEPYHHVFRVFHQLDEYNFPMKNFIVDIDSKPHAPDYLTPSKAFTFSRTKKVFHPLDPSSYPSGELLNLDASQLNAFQHALSRKFSLIQGPPGTGKTYIGQKIVSTLLENTAAQILIICFTNHALDQFLLGIMRDTEDIVRMGNQSKHKFLDKYNIKQIVDTSTVGRRFRACFHSTKLKYLAEIQKFEELQKNCDKSDEAYEKILKSQEKLRKISRKLDELKQITEYSFIKDKRVIGMTTSCAARCNLLLQLLKSQIVIIEEASEVLESHLISSLTKDTQHVILIGDHQQLRPKTSVYLLREKFQIDISLFERMVNNNINCATLATQHRMRPEIANLIRPTIYANLEDHISVKNYENIHGIAKNLFFVDHSSIESKLENESTKSNKFEAEFMMGLANYLILQGYQTDDIVVMTAYNGQMNQLRSERKKYPKLTNIRIVVVDNFQGEESKIILLSLVRSNKENRVGYMAMKNRICVLLSRAKEGFYAIGNMTMLAKCNRIWKEVKEKLEAQEAIGEALPLKCERHGSILNIKSFNDFQRISSDGCREPCEFIVP